MLRIYLFFLRGGDGSSLRYDALRRGDGGKKIGKTALRIIWTAPIMDFAKGGKNRRRPLRNPLRKVGKVPY